VVEISESIDGGVFLIKRKVGDNLVFGLTDDGENVGLTIIVTVSTDTKVTLVGVFVVLEAFGEAENGVDGSLSYMDKLVVKGGSALHLLLVVC
jgi:hypothetical protein